MDNRYEHYENHYENLDIKNQRRGVKKMPRTKDDRNRGRKLNHRTKKNKAKNL